jgi:predicted MFS family arabinose efflux permease
LVVAALMTPLASTIWLLSVALFLLGLGWNFCFVAGSTLLSASLRTNERGRVQGASETIVSLASGLGSLSVGFLYAYGGILGISGGGLLFSLVLIAALVWILWRRPSALPVGGD